MIPANFQSNQINLEVMPVESIMKCFICKKNKDDVHFRIEIDRFKDYENVDTSHVFGCKDCVKRVMDKYFAVGGVELSIDKDGDLHFELD